MNLRNMEKLHLFKSTAPLKSATGSSFFASKRTKKKHLEHQRESFFLACKLMSQLGMARVSSNIRLYYRKDNCRQSKMVWIKAYFTETESENEFRPLDERIDEFHPKATRTLFIGNLEKTTTYHDLLNIFQRFGEIVVCCYIINTVDLRSWATRPREFDQTILTNSIHILFIIPKGHWH